MLINWTNVISIHLWRSVTNLNSISSRSFYAYALYATGLPLISYGVAVADFKLLGKKNFDRRINECELN